MPSLLSSLPIFPDSIPFIEVNEHDYAEYISNYPRYSDFNYTSVYSWAGDTAALSHLNGNLVLWMEGYHDSKKSLSLLGESNIDATLKIMLQYAKHNEELNSDLMLIPEVVASKITDPAVLVKEDRDNHDYLLSTHKYVSLDGHDFAGLRRKVSIFEREYEGRHSVELMDLKDAQNKLDLIRIAQRWAEQGTEGTEGADEEIAAIERLLAHVDEMGAESNIYCLGLVIDKVCEGFCIFERDEFEPSEATLHFIKANIECKGASSFMLVEALRASKLQFNVENMNFEQDMGIFGLRESKMHARPCGFLKKYIIS